jgi:hypothetical protein
MPTTTSGTITIQVSPGSATRRDARTAGLLYLGLGLTGLLGFILIRTRLFDPDDPAATLAHLLENEQLARAGIALEMGVVVTQALAALWFYRLFRSVDAFAAGAIAVFGVVNAVAILVSAAFLATALQVALDPVGDPGLAQLMYLVSDNLWGVGALFFGLWLIPMGWCVLRSRWMPRLLGQILVVGGVGYVLSAFVRYLAPDAGVVADLLAVPATVGEFWMIGYLLIRGVSHPAEAGAGRAERD